MIILIEGVDHTGKTTIADYIHNITNFPVYRSIHQKDRTINLEEASKHDWRFYLDIASQSEQNIIFDRSFISQYVYSSIFRKENILNQFKDFSMYKKQFIKYCETLQRIQYKVIYCTRKNFMYEVDDYIDMSYANTLQDEFSNFFKIINFQNFIEIKYEDGIEYNYNQIREFI